MSSPVNIQFLPKIFGLHKVIHDDITFTGIHILINVTFTESPPLPNRHFPKDTQS